jgi:hypothetical protein
MRPSASFLVLSEDSAPDAVPTLVALLKRAFCLLVPEIRSSIDRNLRFEPPEDRLRKALSGNAWKSKQPGSQHAKVDLVRTIATQLKRDDAAFVVFHFDGDTTYANRSASENAAKFETEIKARVFELLRGSFQGVTTSDDQAHALLTKLIVVVPFYCIESWTYYNTTVLRRLAKSGDLAQIAQWEATPGSVEECERPWSLIAIAKNGNVELAGNKFPIQRAVAAGKSLADAVNAMAENAQLAAALRVAATARAAF